MSQLSVLVTGATGQQGGAVAARLLARGHQVRALVREPGSARAQTLRQSGAELATGTLEDKDAVVSALEGVDAFFSMTTPLERGVEADVDQGVTAAEAAAEAGVSHIVFSSVANADLETGIPHVDSKLAVERHLAGTDLPYTIVAPVWFMENIFAPWLPGLADGRLAIALPPSCRHQQVALSDLANLIVQTIERPEEFMGRRLDVASDQLTGSEAAEILSKSMGREIEYVQVPLGEIRQVSENPVANALNEDFALMYEWFDRVGYSVDIAALHAEFPEVGWHSFEHWAAEQDWRSIEKNVSVA